MPDGRHEVEQLLAETAAGARAGGNTGVLGHVDQVRSLLADDAPAAVLALEVYRLGVSVTEARMSIFLQDVERGKKVLQAARDGAEAKHGTPAERAQESADFQKSVNALHSNNPNLSWHQLAQRAGAQHGCSYKTIQRRATNPCTSLDNARHCPKKTA